MAQERMKMHLSRLKLRNFKGTDRFDLEAAGEDVNVYGRNGVGKTTLADAWAWVLFGKDSTGAAQFDIKTLDSTGAALHGLEHEVEAEIILPSGKTRTLRKVYTEKWTKRRGAANREFTGHTTDHFIDGVPIAKGEYEDAVAKLASEDAFRLLTDPYEFAERMHWQERRKLLLDVCGDVSDAQVIASNKALADLEGELDGRSLDDHRKVLIARRKKINDEIERIPVRIDEQTRAMPEVGEDDEDALKARLEDLRAERRTAEEERSRIAAGGEVAEQTKRLREVEAEIQQIQTRIRGGATEAADRIQTKLSGARGEFDLAERFARNAGAAIEEAAGEVRRVSSRLDSCRESWKKVDAEQMEDSTADTCSACGQSLPADEVEAATKKAQEKFNSEKARRLAAINDEGRRLKEQRDEITRGAESREQALTDATAKVEVLRSEVAELAQALDTAREAAPDPSSYPEYQAAVTEKEVLEAAIAKLRTGTDEALTEARAKVDDLDQRISELEGEVSKFAQRRAAEARIDQLMAEERALAGELEGIERVLYLMEEFIRVKVRMIEDRINSRFQLARFRLFRELVNGGIEECCDVQMGGVPWAALSTSEKINVGLDCINTLTEHFGVAPPVFCDHAESVTDILPTRGQQIRLAVSAEDKVLRVEVGTSAESNQELEAIA